MKKPATPSRRAIPRGTRKATSKSATPRASTRSANSANKANKANKASKANKADKADKAASNKRANAAASPRRAAKSPPSPRGEGAGDEGVTPQTAATRRAAAQNARTRQSASTKQTTRAAKSTPSPRAGGEGALTPQTAATRRIAAQNARASQDASAKQSKRAAKSTPSPGGEGVGGEGALTPQSAAIRRAAAQISRAPQDATPDASEGWHGWDDYAAFYDWENARTVGRRDITFWRDVALRTGGRALELGCGTGRILTPLARQGVDIVGIDRSAPMLARAEQRVKRLRRAEAARASAATKSSSFSSSAAAAVKSATKSALTKSAATKSAATNGAAAPRASLLRGDIRQLPFESGTFALVMAPYGILQSLVRERDLLDTLRAVFDALAPGGRFGLDLVPDVPRWQEYTRRVSMRGRRGPRGMPVTLVESVRQDREKGLTIFDQEFLEGRGAHRRVHRFSLTFRTVSIQSLRHRLERVGFTVDAILGGYDGRPWDPRADTWVLMASKPA